MKMSKIGELAFLVLLVIAIVAGLFLAPNSSWAGVVTSVLVVLGIIVGLLNITESETTPFLVAAIALLLTGSVGFQAIPAVGGILNAIVANIGVAVAPAAIVVAIKAIYGLASTQ